MVKEDCQFNCCRCCLEILALPGEKYCCAQWGINKMFELLMIRNWGIFCGKETDGLIWRRPKKRFPNWYISVFLLWYSYKTSSVSMKPINAEPYWKYFCRISYLRKTNLDLTLLGMYFIILIKLLSTTQRPPRSQDLNPIDHM